VPSIRECISDNVQLVRYFCIGLSAAVIDLGMFLVLVNVLGINSIVGTIVSICLATIWAFALNSIYNFATTDNVVLRFLSYAMVSASGLAISASAMGVFVESLGFDANVVKVLSLPVIFIVQYKLNRHVTFRPSVKQANPLPQAIR
jgi:putative flippase GtrA